MGFSGAKEGRVLIMVISYAGSLFMPVLQNMDNDSHISSALFLLLTVEMKAVIFNSKGSVPSFPGYRAHRFSSVLTGCLLSITKF